MSQSKHFCTVVNSVMTDEKMSKSGASSESLLSTFKSKSSEL